MKEDFEKKKIGKEGSEYLKILQNGDDFIKYTLKGKKPVFIKLDSEHQYLTLNKNEKKRLHIDELEEILIGQSTNVFLKSRETSKFSNSFSIIYVPFFFFLI